MQTRALTLANGLRCVLIHQPESAQAAGLVQVSAGSLQEPARWPGLAHLLEHLLFCDSARFRGEERLMPWIQRQGGQVNATTRLYDSTFFFQTTAGELDEGVARLGDMLAAPTLSSEDIRRECAAIDAEYRLLQTHAPALCEAALLDLAVAPDEFRRFRVGSRAAFGDSVTELQEALHQFHRRYYAAQNCTLWLQGPQPLDALARLAEACGARLACGESRTPVAPPRAGRLRSRCLTLPGEARFWLALPLAGEAAMLSAGAGELRHFWLDDAPGSLMAHLRWAGLCDDLDVEWLWRDGDVGWLALKFSAQAIDAGQACSIETFFYQHLHAVQSTGAAQREHYRQLAAAAFARRAPLEQLRERALGFAASQAANVDDFILHLLRGEPLRLLTCPRLDGATVRQTQGFTLSVADGVPPDRPRPAARSINPGFTVARPRLDGAIFRRMQGVTRRSADDAAAFSFYPRSSEDSAAIPGPDNARFPLLSVGPVSSPPTLLLRPAFFHPISHDAALVQSRELRPLLGALRHLGGEGVWSSEQLALTLPEKKEGTAALVHQIAKALSADAAPQKSAPVQSIALRQLLNALPGALFPAAPPHRWLAAWTGEDSAQRDVLARALGCLPAMSQPGQDSPTRGASTIPCVGSDRALVLFIPLAQADSAGQAALRALGLIYAPRFYQRLRVEQQVGYAVFARCQQVADIDGVLFAVQSPHLGWRTLLQRCKDFLREQTFDDVSLDAVRHALRAERADPPLQALRQHFGLAVHDEQAIAALRLEDISALHQRLLRERRKWRVLVGGVAGEQEKHA